MGGHKDASLARDDFSGPTKLRLAAEAGYRCSLPDCGAPTIGPSDTEPKGFSNSGIAAHITAAASNGPRYDATLTPAVRASHENGIWCCAKHGRMIDNDPVSYTVAQLRAWKAEAIDLQRRAHSTGDIDPNGRIRLMRTTRNDIATRAVKAGMRCRAAIMSGVILSDSARKIRRVSSVEAASINQRMQAWGEELTRATAEATEAMMDVRVNWGISNGEPAGLTALIVLLGHMEEWRLKFTEAMHRIAGVSHPQRPNNGPCDWLAVFNGDSEQRQLLQDSINESSATIDEWAAPFIVSREIK